jgi:uncharacterized protein YbaR (Trm112 family)
MHIFTEIIQCPRCRKEIEYYYNQKDDSDLVAESPCKCYKASKDFPKLLDRAMDEIDLMIKQDKLKYFKRG